MIQGDLWSLGVVAFVLLFGTSAEGPGDGWSPGKPRKLQVEASQIGQGNSVNKKQKKRFQIFIAIIRETLAKIR